MSKTGLSDAQIAELVAGLFVPQASTDCSERLKTAGNRAVPFLASALKDPRVPTTAFDPLGLPNFNSPLYRISDLLENSGSTDATAPFIEYLEGADHRFRKHGAWILGAIALENCIEPVNQILTGEDQDLKTSVMMGIGRALAAGRGAPEFFQAIRPQLVRLLKVEERFGFGQAPRLLAQIDAKYATAILLAPEQFSLDNPQLRHVIAALNETRSPIPHDLLLPLIAKLEPLTKEYRRSQELAEVLLAYAHNPDAQAEWRLRGLLKSPVEEVQTGAARALASLNGLEDFYEKLIELENDKGAEALSDAERNYFAASMYYFEIQNGGPWQYFSNSTADYHGMILAGLRAIGATRTAQVLESAGKVFGPDGPPEDRDRRDEMVESFTDQQAEIIDNLYSVFPSGENIEMLLLLYAADHRSEFKNCLSNHS